MRENLQQDHPSGGQFGLQKYWGISAEYGIPIVNKRISVTPIAMLLGAAPDADPVQYAKTLDRAAKAVRVNLIGGGFGALVHTGLFRGR